jgi:cytochrome bd-type quinol oxidase subunit 2
VKVSIMCPACNGAIVVGDKFCEKCGVKVTAEQEASLRERLEHSSGDMAEHMKQVRAARQVIMVLAVMFVLGGVLMYFVAQGTAETALNNLKGLDANMTYPQEVQGQTVTVGKLREMVESEPRQLLFLNIFLAGLMGGLWVWAKKSVLPAMLVALAVFATVHVASAIMDPKTIIQGVYIKIFAIVALTRGVRAALAARKLETEQRTLA